MAGKRKGKLIRRILYRIFPLERYLFILSKMFFLSFRLGLLKKNTIYDYHYFLNRLVKSGDITIDIGANLGYVSVILARLTGKSGKVYAVEPVVPVRAVLEKNTKRFKNVTILPYALGAEKKSIQLGNDSLHRKGFVASGSHFVMDQNRQSADITFEAEMRRGSELFHDLEKVDFIKCDIEGYEIVVLPEMEPIIKAHRPLLLVELGGENRRKLMSFFEELSYKSYELYDHKLQVASADNTKDVVFIPEEKCSNFSAFFSA